MENGCLSPYPSPRQLPREVIVKRLHGWHPARPGRRGAEILFTRECVAGVRPGSPGPVGILRPRGTVEDVVVLRTRRLHVVAAMS